MSHDSRQRNASTNHRNHSLGPSKPLLCTVHASIAAISAASSFDSYRHGRTTGPAARCTTYDMKPPPSTTLVCLRGPSTRVMCSLSRTCSRPHLPPNHPLQHRLHDPFFCCCPFRRARVQVSKRPRPVSSTPLPSVWACSPAISAASHTYSHSKPGELARGPSGEPRWDAAEAFHAGDSGSNPQRPSSFRHTSHSPSDDHIP
jgi:hypothetical protein